MSTYTTGGTRSLRRSLRVADARRVNSRLVDALNRVPGLVAECYSSCKLRTMRLTCYGMKEVMNASAEGFTLQLGHDCTRLEALAGSVEFLRKSRFRYLRVNVLDLWSES